MSKKTIDPAEQRRLVAELYEHGGSKPAATDPYMPPIYATPREDWTPIFGGGYRRVEHHAVWQ